MRRLLVFFGVAFVVVGIAVVALPFASSGPSVESLERAPSGPFRASIGSVQITPAHCAAPIVAAWRREPKVGGWFGYAPLTSTPAAALDITASCRHPARRRLAGGALFVLCGVAVGIVGWRRPRDAAPVGDGAV